MKHDCDYLTAMKRLLWENFILVKMTVLPIGNGEVNTIAFGKCWEDMNWETLGEYVIDLFNLELDGVKCNGY